MFLITDWTIGYQVYKFLTLFAYIFYTSEKFKLIDSNISYLVCQILLVFMFFPLKRTLSL